MQDLVGQILANRYRVEAFLDRGGMASVYRATDLQRNIPVALKVLKADLAEDVVFLRRFAREATVLQRLDHPHIVRLYDFAEFGHLACLFLEYIDGITLRRRIRDAGGPFSNEELRAWVRPICAGLSYAHGQGVFHCDIKPANLMVSREGRVVVSDFGIARTAGGTVTTISTPGTPDYMAPEQWLGRKLDARTDVYALGVTLFSMVTGGERPFIGESPAAEGTTADRVRWEHLYQSPPSPRVYNASLSPALEALILKALAKEPEARFPTVEAFYLAFEDALSGPTDVQVSSPIISPASQQPRMTQSEQASGKSLVRRIITLPIFRALWAKGKELSKEQVLRAVRRVSAFLSAMLAVIVLVIGINLVNLRFTMFDATFLTQWLTEEQVYARLPALIVDTTLELLSDAVEEPEIVTDFVQTVGRQPLEDLAAVLLPPDWVQRQVEYNTKALFDWLEGQTYYLQGMFREYIWAFPYSKTISAFPIRSADARLALHQ